MHLTDMGRGARFDCTFHEAILSAGAAAYGVHEDGVAAFFINHAYGQGKAIYLNTDVYEYLRMRKEGTEADLRELMRNALTSLDGTHGAFVRAPFVPEHEYGHPLGRTEVSRFRDGNTWYFGILPDFAVDDKSAKPASLTFPAETHVYDVRTHRYLGRGGRTTVIIRPGRAEMYAALPYEITGLSATGPQETKRGERIATALQVQVSNGAPGSHAVRVRIIRPDGKAVEYHARTLYLPHGKGSFVFTPALNEPAGKWKIEVTECVSGKQSCHELRIL
jgi:hypothetical protein